MEWSFILYIYIYIYHSQTDNLHTGANHIAVTAMRQSLYIVGISCGGKPYKCDACRDLEVTRYILGHQSFRDASQQFCVLFLNKCERFLLNRRLRRTIV